MGGQAVFAFLAAQEFAAVDGLPGRNRDAHFACQGGLAEQAEVKAAGGDRGIPTAASPTSAKRSATKRSAYTPTSR
jgi:hypothetical protein